jgi:hypothetical protein
MQGREIQSFPARRDFADSAGDRQGVVRKLIVVEDCGNNKPGGERTKPSRQVGQPLCGRCPSLKRNAAREKGTVPFFSPGNRKIGTLGTVPGHFEKEPRLE